MSSLRKIVCFAVLLAVAGCGFQPLYSASGAPDAVSQDRLTRGLADVFVAEIPTRYGQILRRRVIDSISPQGSPEHPRFLLEISLPEPREEQQGIRSDNIATRTMLTYTARYTLKNYADNKVIMTDKTSAMGSYNIVDSPYATQVAARALKERLVGIVGGDISLRLAAYFRSHPRLSETPDAKEAE